MSSGSTLDPTPTRAELALRLRDDLGALDVGSVELSRNGTAPAGAKSVDPNEWGRLLVAIGSSPALLTLVRTTNAWLARQRQGRVRVKIGGVRARVDGRVDRRPAPPDRRLAGAASGTPHSLVAGPEGAEVIDVFSPPRDDWRAMAAEEPRRPRWPQPS